MTTGDHPLPQLPIANTIDRGAPTIFGTAFTPNMVAATWSEKDGWSAPSLTERQPLALDPASAGIHYGQIVFEGLKAYRQVDGSVAVFRPHAHAARMRRSATRLAMPEPPEELFMAAVSLLTQNDHEWLPDDPALSLYLRPIMLATEPTLALRPSRHYLFLVLAFVTEAFFEGKCDPVSVWVSTDFARAAPGGTGEAKCAGNYAAALLAHADALQQGCHQVVWLDSVERRRIEEMGGMNLLFVHRDRDNFSITTPPLSGTILPGVTRDSLLTIAPDLGYEVFERPITLEEWQEGCRTGSIVETIACGTAAVVTPVGRVRTPYAEWTVGDGTTGPVAEELHRTLCDLHCGKAPAPCGWLHRV